MKFSAFFLKCTILVILFQSCTTIDDGITRDAHSPMGTWKLIALSTGPKVNWIDVYAGYEFTLYPNYEFISERYDTCPDGEFELNDQSIFMNYNCDKMNNFEDYYGNIEEKYYFEELNLILAPQYGDCQNTCYYKYERISIL